MYLPKVWSSESTIRTNNDAKGWHHRINKRRRCSYLKLSELIQLMHKEVEFIPLQASLLCQGTLKRCQKTWEKKCNLRSSSAGRNIRCQLKKIMTNMYLGPVGPGSCLTVLNLKLWKSIKNLSLNESYLEMIFVTSLEMMFFQYNFFAFYKNVSISITRLQRSCFPKSYTVNKYGRKFQHGARNNLQLKNSIVEGSRAQEWIWVYKLNTQHTFHLSKMRLMYTTIKFQNSKSSKFLLLLK